MSIHDDSEPRFLHERGLGHALAQIDWLSRGARHPLSGDGMFSGHLQHPASAVTDPAGYMATHSPCDSDAFAEVLYFGGSNADRMP